MVTGLRRRVQGRHPTGIGSSPGVVARRWPLPPGTGCRPAGHRSVRPVDVRAGRMSSRLTGPIGVPAPTCTAPEGRGLRALLTKEHEGEHASDHDDASASCPPTMIAVFELPLDERADDAARRRCPTRSRLGARPADLRPPARRPAPRGGSSRTRRSAR